MAAYGAGAYGEGPYGGVTLLEAVTRIPQRAPSIRRGGPAAPPPAAPPGDVQAQAVTATGTGDAASAGTQAQPTTAAGTGYAAVNTA